MKSLQVCRKRSEKGQIICWMTQWLLHTEGLGRAGVIGKTPTDTFTHIWVLYKMSLAPKQICPRIIILGPTNTGENFSSFLNFYYNFLVGIVHKTLDFHNCSTPTIWKGTWTTNCAKETGLWLPCPTLPLSSLQFQKFLYIFFPLTRLSFTSWVLATL